MKKENLIPGLHKVEKEGLRENLFQYLDGAKNPGKNDEQTIKVLRIFFTQIIFFFSPGVNLFFFSLKRYPAEK